MPLIWSREKPTEPGFYWAKSKDCSPVAAFWPLSSFASTAVKVEVWAWAGPIPEDQIPRDPTPEDEPMLPCPCGKPFWHAYEESRDEWYSECEDVRCGWKAVGGTREQAIAAWRLRAK